MESIDEKFTGILKTIGIEKCPDCGKCVDRGDVAWNSASTEAGTGYSVLEILCQQCDTEVYRTVSWYPSIGDFEEFVSVLTEEINESRP